MLRRDRTGRTGGTAAGGADRPVRGGGRGGAAGYAGLNLATVPQSAGAALEFGMIEGRSRRA